MNTRRWFLSLALAATACLGIAAAPAQAQPELITEDDVIAGTMDIDFNTRTNLDTSGDLKAGSPALGAKDKYKFMLNVARTTQFEGDITRQPNLYSKLIMKRKQDAELGFNINLAVLNPKDLKQKKVVGKWVGLIPIDTASGAYDLTGGSAKDRALRIAVDAVGKAPAFTDPFGGRLIGKTEKKTDLASYTYKRLVGEKTVQITVKSVDPMRFESIWLAKGPSENYPRVNVTGRLDFDYETSNWFTDGIHLRYTVDGKETEDVITGSIKWVEDKDHATNGKGYYDFNLRFNEEKNKTASTEGAAFEKLSDEEAFFAVDHSVPCLTGKIAYVDTFKGGTETPISSKITYNLNANKLNKQQIMAFFKLWMICVGPTNDE
jgi:hypothetical protein